MKMNNKWIVMVMALVCSANIANAQNRLQIGGINITGGGLQLVGTVSTSTANDSEKDKKWKFIGWSLIVLGSLVEGGDLKAAPVNTVDSETALRGIKRDCSVFTSNLSVSAPGPMISASESVSFFNTDSSKIAQLCSLEDAISSKAAIIKDTGSHQYLAGYAYEVSGQQNLSSGDQAIIQKLFAINGIY